MYSASLLRITIHGMAASLYICLQNQQSGSSLYIHLLRNENVSLGEPGRTLRTSSSSGTSYRTRQPITFEAPTELVLYAVGLVLTYWKIANSSTSPLFNFSAPLMAGPDLYLYVRKLSKLGLMLGKSAVCRLY